MSRPPAGQLTEKEKKFVEGIASGMKPTEAIRFAGYADPEGQLDEVMARRVVQAAVFKANYKALGKVNVYWRDLVEDAKRILHIAMRMGDIDAAMKAAGKVLDTAAKMNEKPLSEKAATEDEASDRQQLAEAVNAASREDIARLPCPVDADDSVEH